MGWGRQHKDRQLFLLRAPWLWGQRELVVAGRGSSLQRGA